MRKGFFLVEILVMVIVIVIISVPLARLSTTALRDIPRAYKMVESNTSILNALRQIKKDVNAAKAFPESFNTCTVSDETLLVELENNTICYQIENDRVLRRTLSNTAVDNNEEITSWSTPKGKIEWRIWRRNGRAYALEVHTYMEQKSGDRLEKKMAGSHLYFVGAHRQALN
jgi:type II secretory pathway pseudopilin PulG